MNKKQKKILTKKEKNKVFIYNVLNGEWELNELKFPLIREYTVGFSGILPLSMSSKLKAITIISVPVPNWYSYIGFGFKLLFHTLWK